MEEDSTQFLGGEGTLEMCLPCRAPADAVPFTKDQVAGPCFLCSYGKSDRIATTKLSDSWEKEDQKDAVETMNAMITNLSASVSTSELVETVFDFFESGIRPFDTSLPPWSKRSIFEHLRFHATSDDHLLITNQLQMLSSQSASLSECSWETPLDGSSPAKPNLRIIGALDRLTRSIYEGIRLRRSIRTVT